MINAKQISHGYKSEIIRIEIGYFWLNFAAFGYKME